MVTPVRHSPDWDPSHHAPGRLELIRRFVNTDDLYRSRDQLSDADRARDALTALGLLTAEELLGEAELEQTRRFREAVRSVFVENDAPPEPGSPAFEFRVVITGVRRIAAESTSPGLLGRLTELSVELLIADRTGQLSRLKACANPRCRWLFWDASRPGTGRWCSMQVCGGQHKARTYRARRKQQL